MHRARFLKQKIIGNSMEKAILFRDYRSNFFSIEGEISFKLSIFEPMENSPNKMRTK